MSLYILGRDRVLLVVACVATGGSNGSDIGETKIGINIKVKNKKSFSNSL